MFSTINGLGTLIEQQSRFAYFESSGHKNIRKLKEFINTPDYNRQRKQFSISEVERLTQIARSSIRDKEKAKDLTYDEHGSDILKSSYTIKDINRIRDKFNKGFFNGSTKRPKNLSPITIATSMFKGGVGKTTHSTHLASHLSLSGLNVLLIDLDPQASASFVFSYIPSVDLDNGDSVLSALIDSPENIKNIIKSTYYDGLDIITSGLELQSADLLLPNDQYNNSKKLGSPLLRLKRSIELIKDNYDVIILDCAPNHAATTMNALAASDGIIIPVSPNMLSYGSSIQFTHTLKDLSEALIGYSKKLSEEGDRYNEIPLIESCTNYLFRILITNDPGDKESQDVSAAIRALYRDFVLPRSMCQTISLSRSSNDMSLLYDIKRSNVRGSKEAFDRGIQAMKLVNEDIMTLLKNLWGLS